MAFVDDVAVLKRAFFELLAEDDYFLPELAGPADIGAGQLLNSMAAAVELVDAGLVEVWHDPDRLIEGRRVGLAEAARWLRDPLRWRAEAGAREGIVRLALNEDGERLWSEYCTTGAGPPWLTRD